MKPSWARIGARRHRPITIAGMDRGRVSIRRFPTEAMDASQRDALRELLWAAFDVADPYEHFTEEDWQHTVGGVHVVAEEAGRMVSHASVIERWLGIGGRLLRTGYVEAVGTAPDRQGRGFGTLVMREVGRVLDDAFELGALGTGRHGFYERLGWRTWRGPTSVRTPDGERPTPDDDGFILVYATAASPVLDLTAPISCDWRPGDVW